MYIGETCAVCFGGLESEVNRMVKQINIKLSDEAVKELEKLRKELKLPSVAEVIRSSIALNKFLELEKKNGNEVVLRHKTTNKERVLVTVR